jgi:deazaflavin-dependent oxidoreductase (nitroreductase family)
MKATTVFVAGRPRLTRPLHGLARRLGAVGRPLSGTRWLPMYALLRHIGRSSGTAYATPVVAFRAADEFVIPLPFGDVTQWARNLFASGSGRLRRGGQDFQVVEPRIVVLEEARAILPPVVTTIARLTGLRQFVIVRLAESAEVSRIV